MSKEQELLLAFRKKIFAMKNEIDGYKQRENELQDMT